MNGFDEHGALVALAATNRPEVPDPTLLRPGHLERLDRGPARPHRAGGGPAGACPACATRPGRVVGFDGAAPGFAGPDLANVINGAATLAAQGRHSGA